MGRSMDEGVLARAWRGQWLEASKLKTIDGHRLQVVFPGRANGGGGPDFLGVIIALEDGHLLKGDLEVHVRARDWEAHGHHRDPAYNGVVAHLVWEADALWTRRGDGALIATVPLKGCLSLPMEALLEVEEPEPPFYQGCRETAAALGWDEVAGVLDRAGDARFEAKKAALEGEVSLWPPSEVLYQGLMKALGYSRNQQAFYRLGQVLPYSRLEALARGTPTSRRTVVLASGLLATGGLLPSQGKGDRTGLPQEEVEELEALGRSLSLCREMRTEEWCVSGLRPANHPRSRVLGAAHLLARYLEGGLVEGLREALRMAYQQGDPRLLEKGLVVPRYLGGGRAREMIVNVILPFYTALGTHQGDSSLPEAAFRLFQLVPSGHENRVTLEMALQLSKGGGAGLVNTGRRQQGLIHLFKGACRHGYCSGCPLGRALAARQFAPAGAY